MTLSDDHFSLTLPTPPSPKSKQIRDITQLWPPKMRVTQHRISDTGDPFKVYLNSIHSNAFSCALAAKALSQPKCILLPWISWHKLVREWRMQSVPSHFSTCTNTGDLETLRKFLLTSYRPGLNGLKRANCSEITLETSNAPFPTKPPLPRRR